MIPYYKDFKERAEHMAEVGLPAMEPGTLGLTFIKWLKENFPQLLVNVMNLIVAPPATIKEGPRQVRRS